MDSLISALIAAEEGGSGSANGNAEHAPLAKNGNTNLNAMSPGTLVRFLSDGTMGPMPAGKFGVSDATTLLTPTANLRHLESIKINATQTMFIYSDTTAGSLNVFAQILTENNYKVTASTRVAILPGVKALTSGSPSKVFQMKPSLFDVGSGNYVLVVGDNTSTPAQIKAVVLTVSGTTITAGSPVTLGTSTGNYYTVDVLAPSKFIVVYGNSAGTPATVAQAFSVAGNVVTAGSAVTVNAATSAAIDVCALDVDKALVAFATSTSTINFYVVTAAANVLTVGGQQSVSISNSQNGFTLIKVTPTVALLSTNAGTTASTSRYYATLAVSGTTVTGAGTSSALGGVGGYQGPCGFIELGRDGTNVWYFVYGTYGANSSSGYNLIQVPIVGGVPTGAAGATVETGTDMFTFSVKYDAVSKTVIYVGNYGGANAYLFNWTGGLTGTWDGTHTTNTITSDSVGSIGWMSGATQLTGTKFMCVLESTSELRAYVIDTALVQASPAATRANELIVGAVQQNGNICMKGFLDGFSGLQVGASYYFTKEGKLTTTSTSNTALGRAISSTEIVLKDYLF